MTFSDTKMKELGRNTWNNTDNIISLIRTPQLCLRHLDGRSLHSGRVQTHTYTHTHTRKHTRTHARTHRNKASSVLQSVEFCKRLKQNVTLL